MANKLGGCKLAHFSTISTAADLGKGMSVDVTDRGIQKRNLLSEGTATIYFFSERYRPSPGSRPGASFGRSNGGALTLAISEC